MKRIQAVTLYLYHAIGCARRRPWCYLRLNKASRAFRLGYGRTSLEGSKKWSWATRSPSAYTNITELESPVSGFQFVWKIAVHPY